jgi:hypothetical protein
MEGANLEESSQTHTPGWNSKSDWRGCNCGSQDEVCWAVVLMGFTENWPTQTLGKAVYWLVLHLGNCNKPTHEETPTSALCCWLWTSGTTLHGPVEKHWLELGTETLSSYSVCLSSALCWESFTWCQRVKWKYLQVHLHYFRAGNERWIWS